MTLDEIQDSKTLPEIGTKVQIHNERTNSWITHTVVGYYPAYDGQNKPQRVFVRVADSSGFLTAREVSQLKIT